MRFISFFTGIAGFDLGLIRSGMECAAQVENDPFCIKILEKNFPDVMRFGDIKNVKGSDLPPADIFVGGFPCQPHSYAGKQRGAEDDRDLWPEYFRIIKEFRPRWVVGENVPGIKRTILDSVLSDLEGIFYETQAVIIPACAVDAPHIRQRVFIFAYADTAERRKENTRRSGNKWQINPNGIQKRQEIPGRSKLCGKKSGILSDSESFTRRLSIPAGDEKESLYPGGTSQKRETFTDSKYNKVLQNELDEESDSNAERPSQWAAESGICGVAYGIPDRMDRLKSLGNAIVPQIAEIIGLYIQRVEKFYNP